MATGPISFRQDWHHTDGKAHTRLVDSWDDLEGVTKVAMLSYDTGALEWVPFTGIGAGGGGAGDASAANQVLELAKLTLIDGKTPALVAGRVPTDGSGVTQPVSGPLTDAQLRAAAVPGSNAAASQADGHSATLGAKADAAWDLAAAAPSSQSVWKKLAGLLDSIRVSLAGTLVVTSAQLPAALTPAGNLKVSLQEDGGAVLSVDDNGGSLTVDASDVNFGATVTPKAASVWDISDRAARLLGVLSAGANKIGTVDIATAPATAKGTQGANGVPTQHLKDAGRTRWSCATVIAGVAGVAAEALLSMVVQRNSAPGAAATTQAVTAGKRLRLTSITVGIVSTAAAVVSVRVTLRCNPGGVLAAASPLELTIAIPSGAALAQAGGAITIPLPDGIEYAGTEQIGLTHLGSVATYTLWASLNGYEY